MLAVGRNQTVEWRPNQAEGWQRGESGQPFPAGNLSHDSTPGGKSVEQNPIAIPDPHRSLVFFLGYGQFVPVRGPEIDEANPPIAITNLAPRLGPLA